MHQNRQSGTNHLRLVEPGLVEDLGRVVGTARDVLTGPEPDAVVLGERELLPGRQEEAPLVACHRRDPGRDVGPVAVDGQVGSTMAGPASCGSWAAGRVTPTLDRSEASRVLGGPDSSFI